MGRNTPLPGLLHHHASQARFKTEPNARIPKMDMRVTEPLCEWLSCIMVSLSFVCLVHLLGMGGWRGFLELPAPIRLGIDLFFSPLLKEDDFRKHLFEFIFIRVWGGCTHVNMFMWVQMLLTEPFSSPHRKHLNICWSRGFSPNLQVY